MNKRGNFEQQGIFCKGRCCYNAIAIAIVTKPGELYLTFIYVLFRRLVPVIGSQTVQHLFRGNAQQERT